MKREIPGCVCTYVIVIGMIDIDPDRRFVRIKCNHQTGGSSALLLQSLVASSCSIFVGSIVTRVHPSRAAEYIALAAWWGREGRRVHWGEATEMRRSSGEPVECFGPSHTALAALLSVGSWLGWSCASRHGFCNLRFCKNLREDRMAKCLRIRSLAGLWAN